MAKTAKKAKPKKPDGQREERIAQAILDLISAHSIPARSDDPRIVEAKASLVDALRSKG
jgi:hypothetical protein